MMHRSTVPATWLISAIALLLAPAVCLIAFRSVVSQMAGEADYPSHIEFARQLAETGALLPHFGYHILVIVVHALTPADWVAAAEIVTLGGVGACAVVVGVVAAGGARHVGHGAAGRRRARAGRVVRTAAHPASRSDSV